MHNASKIEWMDVDSVHPYENNPRINDDAVEAVAASIAEFGFRSPIIVDQHHVIIAGHTRLKAAKRLKMPRVPVIVADDLSEEQVRAYRLADNKTAELSDWDLELLDKELAEIGDIDMAAFGFTDDIEIEVEDVDLDEIEEVDTPEKPEEPRTRPGDMYRLGRHVLLCGDSTSEVDVTRLMNGARAQMVFTDPPWNVDYGERDNPKWENHRILNDNLGSEFSGFLSKVFERMHGAIAGGGSCISLWLENSGAMSCLR